MRRSMRHVAEEIQIFVFTRLICMGTGFGTSLICLITFSRRESASGYCPPSHYWGGLTDILALTSANFEQLQKNISLDSLPKTFQDAIVIARGLAPKYSGSIHYALYKTRWKTGQRKLP
jgi:hypothetical protein